MLKMNQITARKAELEKLLPELKAGRIECIEYGKPGQPYFTFLRMRYIKTAGGEQFQIREVSFGVEGSGDYTQDQEEAINKAMDRILRYHRPASEQLRKALNEMRARRGELNQDEDDHCFSAVTNESTKTINIRCGGLEDFGPLRDAVTITLE